MKKLFLLFAVLAAFTFSAKAEDFSVANSDGVTIYYNITDATELAVEVTSGSYSGDVKIPSTVTYNGNTYLVTSIRGWAFYGSGSGLTSVTIPEGITSIGDNAFYNCSSLSSIVIPESVTSIGSSVFHSCWGLSSITLSNGLTSIGSAAFTMCSSLSAITIPESVTFIGASAFTRCTSLKILNYNADSCFFDFTDYIEAVTYPTFNYSSLTEVNIGSNVRFIPQYFVYGQTSLTSITIPESVTEIGSYAFGGCTGVSVLNFNAVNCVYKFYAGYFDKCLFTEVNIGSNVKYIPYLFNDGQTSLTSIVIPESVTSIAHAAFYDCTGFTKMSVEAVVPPTIESTTFSNVDRSIPVYVADASVVDYQAHEYWKEFNILGISQAETATDAVKADEIDFIQNGNSISFTTEQQVSVYSINGVCVFSGITRDLQLTTRGIYVVVTTSGATKIII